MEFYTIGVFNSTEEEFFQKLIENKIDTFCDIRQRRGVRGAEYSFVNSNRLQTKLNALKIAYSHIVDLAPTDEIRKLQKEIDSQLGVKDRVRNRLGDTFIAAYEETILNKFDFDSFLGNLKEGGSNRVVLFCVEENPKACHRSIISDKLESMGYKITHL